MYQCVFRLKSPTEVQKLGEVNVIDGINFRWSAKEQGWILENVIIFKPLDEHDMFCRVCKKVEKHIINKDGTKVRGKECGTITELKL